MLLAVFLASKEAERLGLDSDLIIDLAFWIIPLDNWCETLVTPCLNWVHTYKPNPHSHIWEGGLAIYGGVIAGFFTILWFANKEDIDIWLLLDIVKFFFLMIAQAIGRWGNFVNQEAFWWRSLTRSLENLFLPEFIIEGMYINGNSTTTRPLPL